MARAKPKTIEQLAGDGQWAQVSAILSEIAGSEVAAYPTTELVGITEAAEIRGTTRPTVAMWVQRRATNGFPDPVIHKSTGALFYAPEVAAWTGPPGRWPARPASGDESAA